MRFWKKKFLMSPWLLQCKEPGQARLWWSHEPLPAPHIPCCQPTLHFNHLTPLPCEKINLHVCAETEAGQFAWGKNKKKE